MMRILLNYQALKIYLHSAFIENTTCLVLAMIRCLELAPEKSWESTERVIERQATDVVPFDSFSLKLINKFYLRLTYNILFCFTFIRPWLLLILAILFAFRHRDALPTIQKYAGLKPAYSIICSTERNIIRADFILTCNIRPKT